MNEHRNRSGRRVARGRKLSLWERYHLWLDGLDRGQRIRYRLLQAAVIVSLVIIVAFLILQSWIRVPQLPSVDTEGEDITSGDVSGEMPSVAKSGRKEGVYTFLLVGKDTAGGGNTDTMILLTYDTVNKKMYGLSLPRDTMVNVSTTSKRLNAVYNYNKGKDKSTQVKKGMAALKKEVAHLTGITPDFYVIVEWEAIGKLVDAVGGVEFDVPFDMDYDDPTPGQDLHIHQKAGLRLLSGDDAMQVIRHRKNNDGSHSDGDVGRLKVQQAFLKAAAKKCLQPATLLKVPELAKIFSQNVTTDLTVGNILAFAQLASGMDAEKDVDFTTAPLGSSFMYKGASLVTLDPEQLLQILNEHLNPYHQDIQRSDLQLVYKTSNGTLAVTSGTLLLNGNTTSSSSSGSGSSKPSTSGGKKNDTTTTKPSQEETVITEPVTPEEPTNSGGSSSTTTGGETGENSGTTDGETGGSTGGEGTPEPEPIPEPEPTPEPTPQPEPSNEPVSQDVADAA